MKYTIEWSEVIKEGETNGRKWTMKKMNLKDEAGELHDGVTTFDDIITGGTLEGEIVIKGSYKNFQNHMKKPANPMFNKTAQIEKVMDRKEESITKFTDRKEESMSMMAAQRDAVLMVTTFVQVETYHMDDLKVELIKWRNWFMSDEFKKGIPPF